MGNCYVAVNPFEITGTSVLGVMAFNGKKNSGVLNYGSNAKKILIMYPIEDVELRVPSSLCLDISRDGQPLLVPQCPHSKEFS